MNIVEAGKFLANQKPVRRKAWPYGVYLANVLNRDYGGRKLVLKHGSRFDDSIEYAFTAESLIADDWEVIE